MKKKSEEKWKILQINEDNKNIKNVRKKRIKEEKKTNNIQRMFECQEKIEKKIGERENKNSQCSAHLAMDEWWNKDEW